MPPPPPPQQADTGQPPQQPTAAQIALHAAELYALERAAARLITAPLRTRLIRIQRDAAASWIRAFGSLTAPADPIRQGQLLADIRRDLADITPDATAPLATWATRALDLGIQQGAREAFGTAAAASDAAAGTAAAESTILAAAAPTTEAITGATAAEGAGIGATIARATAAATLDDQTLRTIAGADSRIAARIADAESALTTAGPAFDDVTQALAHAHRAATDMQAAVVQVVNGASNTGITAVADDLGAQRMWWAEPDACLTCAGMAGRLADPGQPFDAAFAATFTDKPRIWPPGPIETPPIHPHCFPAGVVASGPGVELTFTRWYSGQMVNIRTSSGRVLAVTPNHPVLTSQGWVAAGEINIGADLICDAGLQPMLAVDPDDYQQPSLIEEIPGTLRASGRVTSRRMPVSAEDFHGDGVNGDVDVVRSDRLLGNRRQISEPLKKQGFVGARDLGGPFLCKGYAMAMLQRLRLAANRLVGSARTSRMLLWGLVVGDDSVRLGPSPQRHSPAQQERSDRLATNAFVPGDAGDALHGHISIDDAVGRSRLPGSALDPVGPRALLAALAERYRGLGAGEDLGRGTIPEPDSAGLQGGDDIAATGTEEIRKLTDALTGLVEADQVVEIFFAPFSGHVYNLQTTGGWYIANGIIVHNCRCRTTPWLGSSDGGVDLPAALRREAQRAVLKGWSLPSESNPERVRAAQQLLARGVAAPKTVKAYARAAVRRGRFTTRTVPTGPSRKRRSTP